MFPETKSRETSGLVCCFVIFLDFHFNSNKRITRANQNSRLGTYNNTNLILKTTLNEWFTNKSTFLILSASFSSTSCCFSSGNFWDNFEYRWFLAWGFMFVLWTPCCVHPQRWKLAVFSPPSVTPISTMIWSRALMYHDQDTFDFSQGHVTKNQPMAVPV